MKKLNLPAITLGVLLLTVLAQTDRRGTPDIEIGLSKGSVFDTMDPAVDQRNVSEPGDLPVVAQAFSDQPPLIPHGVADFMPITFDNNACVECHAVEEKTDGDPTPIPDSHYRDLRRDPATVQDAVAGARFNCMSCHVSPGDNKPLVANTFDQ